MAAADAVRRRAAAQARTNSGITRTNCEPERDGTRIRDTVQYALPLGILGVAAHAIAVRRDLAGFSTTARQHVAELFSGMPERDDG